MYQNGVLQPLEALSLEESQQVDVTINEPAVIDEDITGYFSSKEWAEAAQDDISLEEVRQALSTIFGSLSDAVTALR